MATAIHSLNASSTNRARSAAFEQSGRDESCVAKTARRVSKVGQKALKSKSKIISGKYHFRENVLVVKVETKQLDDKGKEVSKSEEEIAFEVVGLSYKEKEGDEYVNVLGARTDATLQPIFKALFKALEEVDNIQPFIKTEVSFDDPSDSDPSNKVLKDQVKTLTFSHYQELGEASALGQPRLVTKDHISLRVDDEYVGSRGQPILLNTGSDVHFVTNDSLKDRTALNQMLATGEWKVLLKEAQDKTLTAHGWTFSSDRFQEYEGAVEACTSALFDEDIKEGEAPSCLVDQFSKIAKSMRTQLRPLTTDVNNLQLVKAAIDSKIDEIEAICTERNNDLEEMIPYRVLLSQRREVAEQLQKVEAKRNHLLTGARAAEDIQALDFATNFRAQRKALGKAAFGKILTTNWYDLLERYELIDCEGDYKDFLKKKFSTLPQAEVDALSLEARKLTVMMRDRFDLELDLQGLQAAEEELHEVFYTPAPSPIPNERGSRSSSAMSANSFTSAFEDGRSDDVASVVLSPPSPLTSTTQMSETDLQRPTVLRPTTEVGNVGRTYPVTDASPLSEENMRGLRLTDGARRSIRLIHDYASSLDAEV